MSVTVKFGTCTDAVNVISKSPTLSNTAITCVVKQPVSVSSPYFIVDKDSVNLTDNFCQCTEFGRFYWIKSVDELAGNRRGVQCEVDPLYSFATDIRKLDVYVARSESAKQSYLYDTELPTEAQMYVDYRKFTGGDLPAKSTDSSSMRYLLILK